ncbi:AbrB/MazE/SpoVT family DNA-binding domain-containing protein [Salicibibacter cibarius]|uniref:AbrB/MazE/SpoVT family DNA-binding domain-containing protein n=1 Tax=Salicibibacter cibarius TaxID=2743000 RepID=A0A7T7C9Z5_9BACI|nr:AbrB/MazE/SpoVT family DNA-binding domain-containing protein [Salicibibacter cibarius]QQK74179.1 AbrB/MazE/SpoVT family DNA-binding domain-containing protein [Salicibibacter cibarius]
MVLLKRGFNNKRVPEEETVRAISERGQTVIPKEFREYLEAHDGDQLEWSVNEKGEVVVSVKKKEDIMDLYGSLPVHEQNERDFEEILEKSKKERLEKRKNEGGI